MKKYFFVFVSILLTACAPTSYKPIQGAQLLMPLEQAKILCEAESEKKASIEISKRADELDRKILEAQKADAEYNATRTRKQDVTFNCEKDFFGGMNCSGTTRDSYWDKDRDTTGVLSNQRDFLFIKKIRVRNAYLRECMAEKGYVGE